MLSFVSNKGSSKPPVLFDIRINKTNSSTTGSDNDVLIFKGPPEESPSVLLTGNIVLSIVEPMYIKSMYLKLYGDVRIKIPLTFHTQKGEPITRMSRFDKRFYEHTWGNTVFKNYLSNMYDNSNDLNSNMIKSNNNVQSPSRYGDGESNTNTDSMVQVQENPFANQFSSVSSLNSQKSVSQNGNTSNNSNNNFDHLKKKRSKSTSNLKKFASSLSSVSLASMNKHPTSNGGGGGDSHENLSNNNYNNIGGGGGVNGSKKENSDSASSSHLLLRGNYEFPFSLVLPGDTVESVEGLPHGISIYKLQAIVERGRFSSDLQVKKHIRIIRTHTADSMDLSETVSVENCWPNKVEYTISTPAKSVIMGSSIPVHMVLVPIAKGLKLGTIKCSLVENSAVCSPYGEPYQSERTVAKSKTANPLKTNRDSNYFNQSNYSTFDATNEQLGQNMEESIINMNVGTNESVDDQGEFQDKWEVTIFLDTPTSLSKCTQDCTILTYLRVRHKLKFVISLINADGHVSELRASLPIQLFISPFVPISCKSVDPLDVQSRHSSAPSSDVEDDNASGPQMTSPYGRANPIFKDNEGDDQVLFDSSTNLLYDSVVDAVTTGSNDNLAAMAYPGYYNQPVPKLFSSNSSPHFNLTSSTANPSNLSPGPNFITNNSTNNENENANANITPINSSSNLLAYSRQHSSIVLTSMLAPPNYKNRVYDKLWDGQNYVQSSTLLNKNSDTEVHTPITSPNDNDTNNDNEIQQEQLDVHQLNKSLENLQIQRNQSEASLNSQISASATPIAIPPHLRNQTANYFSNMSATNIPMASHISRTNSVYSNSPMLAMGLKDNDTAPVWKKDLGTMVRVPSYKDTMKMHNMGSQMDLPPLYDPSDYEKNNPAIEDDLLRRPKQSKSRGTSMENLPALALSNLRRNNSSSNSITRNSSGASINRVGSAEYISDNNETGLFMGQSRPNFISGAIKPIDSNNGQGSLSGHKRSTSSSSLFRKNNTSTKPFGFGMTPLHQQAMNSSTLVDQRPPLQQQPSKTVLGHKSKTKSFSNLLHLGQGQK